MYTDRLRELKYISPSGQEFTLQFDNLSRTGGKKAPVSEYPGQNQAGVQDLGELTPTFPIDCYISGNDYDTEADRFWEALTETGPGSLIHPRWGNVRALPTSRTQTEEFVNGAGRAVFQIEFIRADVEQFEFPAVTDDFESQVVADVDDAAAAITEGVPEEIDDVGTEAGTKRSITDTLDVITDAFDNLAGLGDDIRASIDQTVADITGEIDDLVQAPSTLMTSMLRLYRLPGRVAVDIEAKIDGYTNIYNGIITGFQETTTKYGEAFGLIAVANVTGVAIAAAESTTAGEIPTRDAAGRIITDLADLYARIKEIVQDFEEAGDFSTGYNLLQAVEIALTGTIKGLINRALNLPSERKLILEKAVDPISLVWELYGDIERLDEFMEFNNLQGDEIYIIPIGHEVRYYVE